MNDVKPAQTLELDPKLIVEQSPQPVAPAERYRMTAENAYFCAEKRGFVCGHMLDDWLQAEVEIDRMLQQQAHELPEKKVYLEKLEASYRDWDARHETLKKGRVKQAWQKRRYAKKLRHLLASGRSLNSY
jgi:hypothetical protein